MRTITVRQHTRKVADRRTPAWLRTHEQLKAEVLEASLLRELESELSKLALEPGQLERIAETM